ncbi:hypothetical protein HYALB_00014050 [Hymenoscyphus albidus]|uniref:NACHT domain-containing protein n=1 Tax=Hymenoscyphus albidus TaxID=595503 RepID=A0A9N9M254_9HELO|nr:hypothetical protein HYALB_00014050 [Hymenoscyphus albidus]
MSFGYSIGDCIAVWKLANEIRDRFVEAPKQFKAISNESVLQSYLWPSANSLIKGDSKVTLETKEGVEQLHKRQDKRDRSKEDRTILDWLTPIDFTAQQHDYISRRQSGTGQWLLDSDEFQSWIQTDKQTLFCPGIPGAGKTILASILVEELTSRFHENEKVGIAYIYCNFRRQDEQKKDDLLASLLKQLARHQPILPEVVKDLYNRHNAQRTRPSFDEISRSLQSTMAMYSRVFVVIDALDECNVSDGSRTTFLSELFSLQTKCTVNLFATSRFGTEFRAIFPNSLSLEIRASEHDVRTFLDGHILALPGFVRRSLDLQEEVKGGIVKAVDGMFLLAKLHLDSLAGKKSLKALRSALRNLPSGSHAYDSAYKDAMVRIEGQIADEEELAKQVLSWITCAKRPLTTTELQHALAIEKEESKLDQDNLPDIEDLVTVCAGLVTVDEQSNVIRLVHYTTQEYFRRSQGDWFPDAEARITESCIAYLSFETFLQGSCQTDEEFEERVQPNQLFAYAAQNWGHHGRLAVTLDHDLGVVVANLLQKEASVSASGQALFAVKNWSGDTSYSQRTPKNITGVHLAAYFGIKAVVQLLLDNATEADLQCSNGRTPLSWAARNGHEAVVKLLLQTDKVDADSKDNKYGQTPLSWAAENGHEAVVKLLLLNNADYAIKSYDGWTVMELAALNTYNSIEQLLVTCGVPESEDLYGLQSMFL